METLGLRTLQQLISTDKQVQFATGNRYDGGYINAPSANGDYTKITSKIGTNEYHYFSLIFNTEYSKDGKTFYLQSVSNLQATINADTYKDGKYYVGDCTVKAGIENSYVTLTTFKDTNGTTNSSFSGKELTRANMVFGEYDSEDSSTRKDGTVHFRLDCSGGNYGAGILGYGAPVHWENLKMQVNYGYKLRLSNYYNGTVTITSSDTAKINTIYDTPTEVTLKATANTGYYLSGWSDGKEGQSQVRVVMADGSSTPTPIFTAYRYQINYYSNLSSFEDDLDETFDIINKINSYTIAETPLTFSSVKAEKKVNGLDAYEFQGWRKKGTANTASVNFQISSGVIPSTSSGNYEIEAIFAPKYYNIYFTNVENTNYENIVWTDSVIDETILPSKVEKVGYKFQGWKIPGSADETALTEIIIPKGTTGEKIYEAVFSTDTYNYTCQLEDGTIITTGSFTAESPVNLTQFIPDKPGYTFTGWTGTLLDGANLDVTVKVNDSFSEECNRVYIVTYSLDNYVITYSGWVDSYKVDGVECANVAIPLEYTTRPGPETLNIEELDGATLTEVSIPGYEFLGWSEKITGLNLVKTPHIQITPGTDANREYIAHFKPIEYKIEYVYTYNHEPNNKNSVSITPTKVPTNPTVFTVRTPQKTLTPPTTSVLKNQGYTFRGWDEIITLEDTGKTKETKNSPNISLSVSRDTRGNRVYKALYEPIVYNIDYTWDDMHDDYIDHDNKHLRTKYTTHKPYSLNYGDDGKSKKIHRTGYNFDGFYSNGKKIETIDAGNLGNKTFELRFSQMSDIKMIGLTKLLHNGEFIDFPSESVGSDYPVPEVVFQHPLYEDIKSAGGVLNLTYEDSLQLNKSLNYNPFKYEFLYWERTDGKEPEDKDRQETGIITVNENNSDNIYTAVFKYIPYTIDIYLTEIDETGVTTGNSGNFGEILITGNHEAVAPSYNHSMGGFRIEGLHLDEEINLSIIPYATENARYYLKEWSDGKTNTVLNLIVNTNEWDSGTTKNISPKLILVPFKNTISNTLEDIETLETLFDQSISKFILINGIDILGDYSFYNCSQLQYAFLPGVANLGSHIFDGCKNLKNVILSSKVRTGETTNESSSTGLTTFNNCSNLNLLILPDNYIKLNCFFGENDDSNTPSDNQSLFRKGLGKIFVNKDLEKTYKTSPNWIWYADCIYPLLSKDDPDYRPIYFDPDPELESEV